MIEKNIDTNGNNTFNNLYACNFNTANQLLDESFTDIDDSGNDYEFYYVYDGAGNQITKVDSRLSPTHTDSWTYDFNNRCSVYDPQGASNSSTYTYNLEGKLVRRETPTLDEKYAYDGPNVIADYDGDSSDVLLRRYLTPFLDDNAIMFTPVPSNPDDVYYYFKDGLGSIRQIIDDDTGDDKPVIEGYYDYYGFGNEYAAGTSDFSGNRYRFTAREYHSESSEYYYRNRRYSPSLSRFTSRDPFNIMNLYSYVTNNPVFLTDPYGLIPYGASSIADKLRKEKAIKSSMTFEKKSPPKSFHSNGVRPGERFTTWTMARKINKPNCCPGENPKKLTVALWAKYRQKTMYDDDGNKYTGIIIDHRRKRFIYKLFRNSGFKYSHVMNYVKPASNVSDIIENLRSFVEGNCACVNNLTITSHGNFDPEIFTGTPESNQRIRKHGKRFGNIIENAMCKPCLINLMSCYSGKNSKTRHSPILHDIANSTGCTVLGSVGQIRRNQRFNQSDVRIKKNAWGYWTTRGIRRVDPGNDESYYVNSKGEKAENQWAELMEGNELWRIK